MADIPGALLKLNDIEVAQDAPDTESLWNKTGANINQLIDDDSNHETRVTALEARATADEALIAASAKSEFYSGTFSNSPGNTGFNNIASISGTIKSAIFLDATLGGVNHTLLPGQTLSFGVFSYRISGSNFQIAVSNGASSFAYFFSIVWV